MSGSHQLPYSRQGLENLAAALNVTSAVIWLNPVASRLEVKEVAPRADEDVVEALDSADVLDQG